MKQLELLDWKFSIFELEIPNPPKERVMAAAKKATNGNDTIFLGKQDDVFHALAGQDEVHGGGGNDTLYGDDDNDTLYGDAGNDQLFGGGGDDVLLGGAGTNLLDGGAGINTASFADYVIADQPVYVKSCSRVCCRSDHFRKWRAASAWHRPDLQ